MASLTLAVSPKSSALTISLFILIRRARDGALKFLIVTRTKSRTKFPPP